MRLRRHVDYILRRRTHAGVGNRVRKNETWKVAVKVIDPRGNEGLRILTEGRA